VQKDGANARGPFVDNKGVIRHPSAEKPAATKNLYVLENLNAGPSLLLWMTDLEALFLLPPRPLYQIETSLVSRTSVGDKGPAQMNNLITANSFDTLQIQQH
jgi:hypothetical protein